METIDTQMDNIEVRLIDGNSVSGQFERPFRPMEWEIAIRSQDKVHVFSLDQVCCVLFVKNPNEAYPSHQPGEIVEDIKTKREETYTVRVLQQQAIDDIGPGFYGVPFDQKSKFRRIFFSKAGILNRSQRRRIGEILKEEGGVSNEKIQIALNKQSQLRKRKLGEILSDKRQISQKAIEKALEASQKKAGSLRIGEILIAANLVTNEKVEEALEEQRSGANKQLGKILVENKIVSENDVLMAMALKFRMRFVDLRDIAPSTKTLDMVSSDLVRQMRIFPIDFNEKKITIATSNPGELTVVDTLRFHTGHHVEMVVASAKQIETYIDKYYSDNKEYDDFTIEDTITKVEDDQSQAILLKDEAESAPIIRLANKIILDGINANASDIHLLPQENGLKVSFRINSLLEQRLKLDQSVSKSLVARFKITALMDIAQHRLPQDGRIRVRIHNHDVELRVSCMPGQYGENLVLRILDKSGNVFSLDQLGIDIKDLESFRNIVRSTHGMLLVTGPTGSGKSTTLSSVMQDLVEEPKHLLSLEDPIEASVAGINQIQINEKIGFSFATALRNVLRHDPDVIMVGEIRDSETAKIAVQGALTGHVLISSLHTNRAAGAFTRLVDMGVEPYLVSATLKGVIAQQLLPKLCEDCRSPQELDFEVISFFKKHGINIQNPVDYVSTGCDQCRDTGISGRVMVYEFLKVNKDMQKLVTQEAPEETIQAAASKSGMRSLVNMAVEAHQNGLIPIDHVMPLFID